MSVNLAHILEPQGSQIEAWSTLQSFPPSDTLALKMSRKASGRVSAEALDFFFFFNIF